MKKLIGLFAITLLSFSPMAIAQTSTESRECPPDGYYGATSNICPPPIRTTQTWEANELQKRESEDSSRSTHRIVCETIPDGRNDETDVHKRCRVEKKH